MFAIRTSSGVNVVWSGTGDTVTIISAPRRSRITVRIRSRSSSISATVRRWNAGASDANASGCGIWRNVLPVARLRQVSISPSVTTTTPAPRNTSSAAASLAARAASSAASSG